MVRGLLVIVPCGQKKIWSRNPKAGATPAKDAYTGPPFAVNKAFAEQFGESWVVLSAKYGFIKPDFKIRSYNVTFKKKSSGPVETAKLREQIRELKLDQFSKVVGLGGKAYRQAINDAFEGMSVKPHFPFKGLQIGKMMQATNRAIKTNKPFGKAAAERSGKKSKRKNA